jgi:hypothetical protein
MGYHNSGMKPEPAPHVPGETEAERFDNAVRQMFAVSKDALSERRSEVEQGSGQEEADEENRLIPSPVTPVQGVAVRPFFVNCIITQIR